MIGRVRIAVTIVCVSLWATSAAAQADRGPLPGGLELSAGVAWIGSTSLGSSDATLTGPAGDRYRLFTTSSDWRQAAGGEVRLGGRVTRLVEAEAVISYAKPRLSTSIGSDAENAATTVAFESLTQIAFEGAGVVHLPFVHVGRRALPFVTAGGGYLRELHEGSTLAQSGATIRVGGGVKISLLRGTRPPRGVKQAGLRADAVAIIKSSALAFDGRSHTAPALSASLFARF